MTVGGVVVDGNIKWLSLHSIFAIFFNYLCDEGRFLIRQTFNGSWLDYEDVMESSVRIMELVGVQSISEWQFSPI